MVVETTPVGPAVAGVVSANAVSQPLFGNCATVAPWLDVCTVLDVVWRPELLRRSVVSFVEQHVERFQNKPFVSLTCVAHLNSSPEAISR